MISSLFHIHIFLLILVTVLCILATIQAQRNVSVADSLSANDEKKTWNSPNGDFAFGFHLIPDQKDQFLLAIWYAKIPVTTIVWYAKRDQEEDPAISDRESKVELIRTGHLVLKDPKGIELWRSEQLITDSQVSHASMLDTGNFVIASENSSNIWESFKYPTDTILPGQELNVGDHLLSTSTETNYNKGKYQLLLNNSGFLILSQLDFTRKPYDPYFTHEITGSRLIFNESGYIQIGNSTIAPESSDVPRPNSDYYRATLNFDGVLTMSFYPRNQLSGSGNWSVVWFKPNDFCNKGHPNGNSGNAPCGYNSICEIIKDGRPICTCPPGFSFLDETNLHSGCKKDYSSDDCNPDGSTIGEDRFEIQSKPFFNFPSGDCGVLSPATELECQQSCLRDCSCAVSIFNTNDNGTCYKKRLPLSNGRVENSPATKALFKVLKSYSLSTPTDEKKQSSATLILSVLLGASVTFNFLSLAAISLIFFCLYRNRIRGFQSIPSEEGLETNLRSFAYKDIEKATNGFKEEIGKGAFGTVYKGDLPSSRHVNVVAVKKLEKLAQEGEKEFKTEVEVIGQTHHKNLVKLLGYCNEGVDRLLVYEFMGNGSLSSFLFGVLRPSWERRLQIASGIAKGLTYLHEECSKQIIHCDIKPQNILLDDSFTAKISDFGLAKLLIDNKTRTRTDIRGTKGYVAPEWFRNTPVSVKVDVYSFGVMLLEIICCRKCVHVEMEEAAILTEWAVECYKSGSIEKLVEKDEEARSDIVKLETLVKVAIWCVQEVPSLRPSMRTVTMMLEGAVLVPAPPYPFLVDSMSSWTSGSSMM